MVDMKDAEQVPIGTGSQVALATAPQSIIGSVAFIDDVSAQAMVRQSNGVMALYPKSNLVGWFTEGWYRLPAQPFAPPVVSVVTVVYRANPDVYPEYTIPVNVSDA